MEVQNINTIKRKIAAAILAIASILGVASLSTGSASAARPSVVATSATDCSQSAFLGTRVCIDPTTPYGTIAYIYTGATSLFGTYVAAVSSTGAFVATPIEYTSTGVSGVANFAPAILPGPPFPQISYQGNATLRDLLAYFAGDSTMEFVITN